MDTEELLHHPYLTEYRVSITRNTIKSAGDTKYITEIVRQHLAYFYDRGFECKYCWTTRAG